jgi:hypothetical protein
MTVYVMSHKKFNYKLSAGYVPMLLGAQGKNIPVGYLSDSEGKNISFKNQNYCELTGLYEIWKNYNDSYVGLAHYRRYFLNRDFKSRFLLYALIMLKGNIQAKPVTEEKLRKLLEGYDWIIPTPEIQMGKNLWSHYGNNHYIEDLEKTRDVIADLSPEYLLSFDKVLKHSNKMAPFNMFYTKKEQLDCYCEWLFNILFELEKRVDISQYDSFQCRLYGFISEELFNVWIDKNRQLKVKYLTVYNTHLQSRKSILERFKERGRVK